MNSFLLFLFKSTFCLSLLYLAFNVLMRKETFFKLNRMILLLMVISSLIIPFISSPQLIQPFVQVKLKPVIQNITILEEPIQTNVAPTPIQLTPVSKINQPLIVSTKSILLFVYFSGVFISFLLLLYSIANIAFVSKSP